MEKLKASDLERLGGNAPEEALKGLAGVAEDNPRLEEGEGESWEGGRDCSDLSGLLPWSDRLVSMGWVKEVPAPVKPNIPVLDVALSDEPSVLREVVLSVRAVLDPRRCMEPARLRVGVLYRELSASV